MATDSLDTWKRWCRCPDCTCPWEFKGLGRQYGVSLGKGWVRMETDPACPHHGH